MTSNRRMLKQMQRLYKWMVLAYPTRFRKEFGTEVAQVFGGQLRAAASEAGLADMIKQAQAKRLAFV